MGRQQRRRGPAAAMTMALIFGASVLAASPVSAAETTPSVLDVLDPEKIVSHLLCYRGKLGGFSQDSPRDIKATSALNGYDLEVEKADRLCNPVEKRKGAKQLSEIVSQRQHAKAYRVDGGSGPGFVDLIVTNQFGVAEVEIFRLPGLIMVPTRKFPHRFPNGMDHYLCYGADEPALGVQLKLIDQFKRHKRMVVGGMTSVCLPAEKTHGDKTFVPRHPQVSLACYDVTSRELRPRKKVRTSNQFEKRRLNRVKRTAELCVPSFTQVTV